MYSRVAARLASKALVNSASVTYRPVGMKKFGRLRLVAAKRHPLENHFIFPFDWIALRESHDLLLHQVEDRRLGDRDVLGDFRHRPAIRYWFEGPLRKSRDGFQELVTRG
jgi:hypothetical protein